MYTQIFDVTDPVLDDEDEHGDGEGDEEAEPEVDPTSRLGTQRLATKLFKYIPKKAKSTITITFYELNILGW